MVTNRPARAFAAVLFDMDGTLLDTERIAYEGFVATCEQFSVVADFAAYCRCIGTRGDHTRDMLGEILGEAAVLDEFFAAWETYYIAHAVEAAVPVKPGAEELLEMLREHGIPMAVVTSTRTGHARRKLDGAGLLPYFEFVVGGDEVPRSKPEPLIYQRAAARIGHPAGHCLAVEDSANGIVAAHRAGCRTVHVPDLAPLPARFEDFVHERFDSLTVLCGQLQRELDPM